MAPAFIAACAALAVLLFWLLVRFRGVVSARRQSELVREVEARTAELAKLAELTEQINRAVTLEEVLEHLYVSLAAVIPYDRIGLALLSEDRVELRAVWSRGRAETVGIGKGYQSSLAGSSLEKVLESGEPRVIPDLVAYLEAHPDSESTRRILSEGVRSSMTCPLRAMGRPVGFLFFSSFTPGTYDERHVRFMVQIAGHLSLVIGKSQLYDDLLETKRRLEDANRHLEALASADGLTGIANRRAFDLRLDEEWRRHVRTRAPLSLLMIDVDRFKAYNDEFGHTVGDDCLRAVAAVLGANLRRAADLVARFGGEEFAVILPETDEATARAMAERLRTSVEGLRLLRAASGVLTVSVGSATLLPGTGRSAAELVQAADAALYEAKRAGRNRAAHRNLAAPAPA